MHKKLLEKIGRRLDKLKHKDPRKYEAGEKDLRRVARRLRA